MSLEIKIDLSDEVKVLLRQLVAGLQLAGVEGTAIETSGQKKTEKSKASAKARKKADKSAGKIKKAKSQTWRDQRRDRILKQIKGQGEISQSQLIADMMKIHGYSQDEMTTGVLKGIGASMSHHGLMFEKKRRGQNQVDPWYKTEKRETNGKEELYYIWNPPSSRSRSTSKKASATPAASGSSAEVGAAETNSASEGSASLLQRPSKKLNQGEEKLLKAFQENGKHKRSQAADRAATSLRKKYSDDDLEPPFEMQGDSWVRK